MTKIRKIAKIIVDVMNHLILPEAILPHLAGVIVCFHSNSKRQHRSLEGLGVCNLSPERILKLIGLLQRRYHLLSFDELADRADKGKWLRGTALLAFDDGFKSIYQDLYLSLRAANIPFIVFVNSLVADNSKLLWLQKLSLILQAGKFRELFNALADRNWIGCDTIISGTVNPSFLEVRECFIDFYDHQLYSDVFDTLLARIGISEEEEAREADLFLSSEELWEMRDLCTIGNHTHSHSNIAALTPVLLETEIKKCNTFIRDLTGKGQLIPFAVPFGPRKYLTKAAMLATKQHCHFVFTAYGYGNLKARQRQLRRIIGDILAREDLKDFNQYVACISDRRRYLFEWASMAFCK